MDLAEAAWLAGFWDGEGHLSVHSSTKSGDKVWYQASMGLRNTHLPSMNVVASLLDRVGVKYHLRTEDRGRHRTSYWLNVTGMENILNLLDYMRPFLVTKVRQADLVAEYCRSRLVATPRTGYSKREKEIQLTFKTINSSKGT